VQVQRLQQALFESRTVEDSHKAPCKFRAFNISVKTGERPFICPQEDCEKTFREKGNLLTHIRTHLSGDLGSVDENAGLSQD